MAGIKVPIGKLVAEISTSPKPPQISWEDYQIGKIIDENDKYDLENNGSNKPR